VTANDPRDQQEPDPQDPDSDYEAPDPGHTTEWKGKDHKGTERRG